MNLKQFHYVLILAQEASFAKAAGVLGISQPSLSQYIKKIENQLGVELFNRTGGNVSLTDAGRIYMDAGRKILDLERQMCSQFDDLAGHKTGSLVIGTSPYRSASMMPVIAKRFQEKYPGMHLVVEEMTSQELMEAAEHGQFDFCITMKPVDTRLFRYVDIACEEMVLAVPASMDLFPAVKMPNRKFPAVDAAVMDGQSFVMITEGQWMQRSLQELALEYNLSLTKAAVVKSLEAQIAMVRAGIGMALLPSGIERFCAPGEVHFYSFVQDLPKREVVVMWPKERYLSQAAHDFLDEISKIDW